MPTSTKITKLFTTSGCLIDEVLNPYWTQTDVGMAYAAMRDRVADYFDVHICAVQYEETDEGEFWTINGEAVAIQTVEFALNPEPTRYVPTEAGLIALGQAERSRCFADALDAVRGALTQEVQP
jgi:hypothetical protein